MALNQALMDDLVVIPTISLNPKKAKKKLKKAARMNDDVEVSQLPVYQEAKENISPLGFSLPPSKETQRPAATKSSPKSKPQVRSMPAPKAVERPAPTVIAKPVAQPQACAVQALATSEGTKRSWFDITEEDEDDFIGLSFTGYPASGMVA